MENIDIYKLDGRTLRMFLSIYETGSVSKTATRFELNQSTVSHTLEKLRAALGDPLFVRSGRNITPTEKALAIVPRVRQLLASLEGLVESETYDVARDTRPLCIAIPTPALVTEMQKATALIWDRAPKIEVHIKRLAPREQATRMLDSGQADIAICVAGLNYSALLNHCPFGSDELAVFYDPEIRGPVLTREDYAAANHAVAGFGGRSKSVVETALAEHKLQRRIALAAPTASMLGELIRGTDLIATMPSQLANNAYRHLAHCPPPLTLPRIHYEMVWHRRNEHSGRNVWLRNTVLQCAAN